MQCEQKYTGHQENVLMLQNSFQNSTGTNRTIWTADLVKRKLCAGFVKHQLNVEQKIARVEHCKHVCWSAENDPDFYSSFISDREIWCFTYGAEWKTSQNLNNCVFKTPERKPIWLRSTTLKVLFTRNLF